MHAIVLASIDKRRPALVLTRERALRSMTMLTVAAMSSTIKGLATEVPLGPANGLDHDSVVSLDNVYTLPAALLSPPIGWLLPHQEQALAMAIHAAFDLDHLL